MCNISQRAANNRYAYNYVCTYIGGSNKDMKRSHEKITLNLFVEIFIPNNENKRGIPGAARHRAGIAKKT